MLDTKSYPAKEIVMSLAHEKYIEWKHQRNVEAEVGPRTTVLLIIDMQEYFLDAQSPLSRFSEMQTPGVRDYLLEHGKTVVIPNLERLLAFFRTQNLRVIYTTVASELPDGQDWPPILRRRNALSGVSGTDGSLGTHRRASYTTCGRDDYQQDDL
jgi:hypothetical protein